MSDLHTLGWLVIILTVLVVEPLSILAMWGFALRSGAKLTTQTDQVTGVKVHGLGWWLLASQVLAVLPLILFGVYAVLRTFWWVTDVALAYWWAAPILAGLTLLGVAGQLHWRNRATNQVPDHATPLTDPQSVAPQIEAPPAPPVQVPDGYWARPQL